MGVSDTFRGGMRRILFRYGWDTRCRHRGPVRLLRETTAAGAAADGCALLDVGCGRAGMAAFLDGVPVMGVDLEPPPESLPNREFTRASITDLPFPADSYAQVSCIDVLQDLPLSLRDDAIAELVRVARESVVIASPQGKVAERVDAEFERALRARGAHVPPWVVTSLANPYPTVADIVAAVRRSDPSALVSVSYAEPVRGSKLVRAAAVRSRVAYAIVNLCLGLLLPAMRAPDATRAYRAIVVIRPGKAAR
jgi:hypothetical protein